MKSPFVPKINWPLCNLFVLFLSWKCLLLSLAVTSPGVGYDTSTNLLLNFSSTDLSIFQKIIEKLTRWDAIYFVSIAKRGYRFEQEWAFGWGFSRFVSFVTRTLPLYNKSGVFGNGYNEAVSAIIIANASHLVSVFILYELTRTIWPGLRKRHFAFVSASLHIISPAGLFLSAPYAESSFSLFSYLGYLLYAKSLQNAGSVRGDIQVIFAGATFGISTTLRSNGLLNGIIFLTDVLVLLRTSLQRRLELASVRRLLSLCLGGILVATGFVIPQTIAWHEYCLLEPGAIKQLQPWCSRTVPSVYNWVQSHYWNVGFLKYWTLPNIPLFVLATPTLVILVLSAVDSINRALSQNSATVKIRPEGGTPSLIHEIISIDMILWRFALPQLILASLATTNYHVQIITRISSGFVVWYWWIASLSIKAKPTMIFGSKWNTSRWVIQWMVIYGMIQAGLFASFLPPA